MTKLAAALLIAAISAGAPPSAHDRYRIIGTVSKITTDEITVKQAKDDTLVEMDHDKKTKVTRDGRAAKITDVKAGSTVVIDALGDSILDLVVLEIRLVPPIPVTKKPEQAAAPVQSVATQASYVGSQACRRCHTATYDRWSTTRMAHVVVDPKAHPEAIIPDLSRPDPLVTFKSNDIALVYGSRWKQRYFTKVGADYFPLGAQWDIANRIWRPYYVQPNTDWWVPHYPPDNMRRPTGPLCDGCHSVNYNITTRTVTEWNVGCERCHGPGGGHIAQPTALNIVNPAKLDFVRANDTCIQCHSQGQPLKNPIAGQYYDWPVGFHMGGDLKDYWQLEEHKLGETTFTHFADGTAHKNRMQGNDFIQSAMYKHGVTCFSCHDAHGTPNESLLIKPSRDLCLTCHNTASPNGPRGASLEAHTHHAKGSPGSDCVACHMPRIEQTIANVNVRSHTFNFITPTMTEQFKIPNPCTGCHTDKTPEWAKETMRTWSNVSPWRGDR